MLLASAERTFEQDMQAWPRCSSCGTSDGPLHELEGMFTVLMCAECQATRSSSNRGLPNTRVEMSDQPSELLTWDLELHTAAQDAGWSAIWQAEQMRVSYRRVNA
jgi:hypothetical protein